MKYLKVLIVLAVFGAYPAIALAHKAPTKQQRTALVRATDSYLHEPIPGKCLREEISTPITSWAEVGFAPGPNDHLPVTCAKFAADVTPFIHASPG